MADPNILEVRNVSVHYISCVMAHCALKLEVPSLLEQGPKTSEELAHSTGVLSDKMDRMLLFLEAVGIFKQNESGQWENNEKSNELIGAVPNPHVILNGMESTFKTCSKFCESLSVDESAHELAHGMDLSSYLQQNPQDMEEFSNFKGLFLEKQAQALIPILELADSSKILYAGFGNRSIVFHMVKKFPDIHVTITDKAEVLEDIQKDINIRGLQDRITLLEMSPFETIPDGFETIVIANDSRKIEDADYSGVLARCKQSGSKLVMMEAILVPESEFYSNQRIFDVDLMCIGLGPLKTKDEMVTMIENTGYKVSNVQTPAVYSIIYAN